MGSSMVFSFAPVLYGIARKVNIVGPEVPGQSCLFLQLADERPRRLQLRPYLRQVGGAMPAEFKYDAIPAGMQLRQRILLAAELDLLWLAEQRYFDGHVGEFLLGQRREAGIAKGRRQGVFLHIFDQRAQRFQASDAAAQTIMQI